MPAVHSTKRRKLEHNSSDEESDAIIQNGESDQENESDESEKEETKSKHKVQKNTSRDDHEAMYSVGLYKSSMFKLQLDNLLADVRPNYEKYQGTINGALHEVKALIEGIADREPLGVAEATELMRKHKIVVPYPDPKPNRDALYKLAYAKPSKINVAGSYILKTMVKSDSELTIDMTVTMPESILQEKDYVNYRYFYKRAYYLSCIAAGLQESKGEKRVLQFEYLNGNSLQPILVIKCGNADSRGKNFNIQIIPAAPEGFFKEVKLRPEKSAIRPKDDPSKESTLSPSPFYNATLQSDAAISKYIRFLDQASKRAAGFTDACMLGRIWLQQRGYGSRISQGGFGHFEWATLTALLLLGGGSGGGSVLKTGYSSYQLFKAVVQYLATSDLATYPATYQVKDYDPEPREYPIFYDGQRGLNFLFKMSPWSYASLREEAKTTIEMLNDAASDNFQATFILKCSYPLQKYDRFVQVALASSSGKATGDHEDHIKRKSNSLYRVLKRALTDRVRLIDIQTPDLPSWSLKTASHPYSEQNTVLVRFMVNPATVERMVDRGPTAEEEKKAGNPFQKFWGDIAELRRLDNVIAETIAWSQSDVSPFQQIISYILKLQLGISPSQLTFREQSQRPLVPDSNIAAMAAFNNLMAAYRILEDNVVHLENIPLQVRQLSPVDSQLRYASVDPPHFSPQQYLKTPAEVLVQFEGSSRWPDDVVAIQRTKIAILVEISNRLQESVDGLSARVGLENSPSATQSNQFLNAAFLDVCYPSGAVFRLRIHNEREQILLERLVKDKSTNFKTIDDARSALAIYKRDFIQIPLLTQSISTHCTRFPTLSPTIRLLKKWVSSHLLSNHVPSPLIEIIAIRTFIQPFPWRAPSSAIAGFFRTLKWLSKWDWVSQPLVVDFTSSFAEDDIRLWGTNLAAFTADDIKSFGTNLEAWRKVDPGMNHTVLLVGTNHDRSGTAFTSNGYGPSVVITKRMMALARSATKLVEEKGLDLDVETLFKSSTAEYDFSISFKKAFTKLEQKSSTGNQRFKNLAIQEEVDTQTIGFDPISLYIEELEQLYGDCAVLFSGDGGAGGDPVVAGLWKPGVGGKRRLKINAGFATKPCPVDGEEDDNDESEERKVEINKEVMLAEMARLGGDMIKSVRVKGS